MGLNDTPAAGRVHIGFFGRRNAGKSSLVNAVTGQNLALVSPLKGTTTDPVYKAMELLPLGPVMIIDTPGIDDDGPLGALRVERTRQVLHKTDVAVLIVDAPGGKRQADEELIDIFRSRNIPYLLAYNKSDLLDHIPAPGAEEIYVSALGKYNIDALKEKIAALAAGTENKLQLVGDLINPADFVVLVTPIDKAAPKGRLILPQQQTIRDILEADAAAIVVKEFELRETLSHLAKKPKLVITDSQVFAKAAADTPADIPLTSFSILFARYKGMLEAAVKGIKEMERLEDGDLLLIAEGCTHHRQCDDIGSVKLPRWIRNYTGRQFQFAFTSGGEFPEDLSPYKLIIHCGGCMLNERAMKHRCQSALAQGIRITNYGILIAYMQGILRRSLAVFPHVLAELEE
ncbi:MAG: [FeFe] hydrogenase H-cluster maturation GTPase HydF [Desulfarculales bacterium]|jgi:[FeFe] hydrogenase H-cluster maturation GTPase HydF|nr:[FeFe] hydrogenase H-cluster maturation GTPase HydF [Desulfarculales bacterium]